MSDLFEGVAATIRVLHILHGDGVFDWSIACGMLPGDPSYNLGVSFLLKKSMVPTHNQNILK